MLRQVCHSIFSGIYGDFECGANCGTEVANARVGQRDTGSKCFRVSVITRLVRMVIAM